MTAPVTTATQAPPQRSRSRRCGRTRDHDLYDLKVRANGRVVTVRTTRNHLIWDPYLDQFIPANRLKTGEKLKTPDDQSAVAVGGSTPTDQDGWMWDLSVPGNNDHDFYVIASGERIDSHTWPTQAMTLSPAASLLIATQAPEAVSTFVPAEKLSPPWHAELGGSSSAPLAAAVSSPAAPAPSAVVPAAASWARSAVKVASVIGYRPSWATSTVVRI